MKDWMIRAIKTFVQAFGGIFVPEACLILSGKLPADLAGWKAVIIPLLCSAVAAGIAAAWNIILEHLKDGETDEGL